MMSAGSSYSTRSLYNNTVEHFVPQNMPYTVVNKAKFISEHPARAQRESRGIALVFLQPRRSVGGKCHALPPGNDQVPTVQGAGWAPGPVWTCAKNLAPPPGFEHRTVKLLASRYSY